MSLKEQPFTEEEVEEWFEDEASDSSAPPNEDPGEKYIRSQLRVVRETKDYQLDYLRHTLQAGRQLVDTAPAYQRRLRWDRKKRSLLIESFLLNIPVPPVYLYERDYNAYEVIDGRQRLEAINAFLSNDFSLTGLEYWKELNGKRFNDLPKVLCAGLLRRSLQAVVLLAETQHEQGGELDVRRLLFDRLNTGGIRLNPQELRNALYPGPLNALLTDLARSDPFTRAWEIPPQTPSEQKDGPPQELAENTLYKTMADAELVLRVFALADAVNNDRKGSLRRILDRYMEEYQNAPEEHIMALRATFERNLQELVDLFAGEPFRLPGTGRPSRPLYDALMIARSRHPKADILGDRDQIRARLAESLKDPASYEVLVGRGNTIQALKDRVALASDILTGAPGGDQ